MKLEWKTNERGNHELFVGRVIMALVHRDGLVSRDDPKKWAVELLVYGRKMKPEYYRHETPEEAKKNAEIVISRWLRELAAE